MSQQLIAPKTWLSAHKHGPSPVADNVGEFAGHAAKALQLGTKLKPITG
ncbi:hypothetical protein [Pseudomonas sp. RT6P73]